MKKIFLALLAVAGITFIATAQESKTMYIMKNGEVVYQSAVSDIDSLIPYLPSYLGVDEGVVINGVKWATRNVDAPGTFAANPEDVGMFYQWNRPKAWPATGNVRGWDSSMPTGNTWEKANDPSPAGWRIPTSDEIYTLLDTAKVSNEWITQNGINGRKFADKATGNSLFLPATSALSPVDGRSFGSSESFYWSSTAGVDFYADSGAYYLGFDGSGAGLGCWSDRYYGFSVRAVAE